MPLLAFALWLHLKVLRKGVRVEDGVTLALGDAGLVFEASGVHTERRWESFHGLVETPSLFILRYEQSRGVILPKRIFSSDGQLQTVEQFLRDRVKQGT